jgi:hypothetical protein
VTPRLPDFIIPGVAKCGSTTLYRWLTTHERIYLPATKEPNFFSDDGRYRRGVDWYTSLFAAAPAGSVAGEASVGYMAPEVAPVAAARIAAALPDVRLVVLLREPVARLRSHYRHEVQRGRERRPLSEAVRDEAAPYVAQSCYFSCLAPFLDRFEREQFCIVTLEDLTAAGGTAWPSVLRHLGVDAVPRPGGAFNVTAEKPAYSPIMRWAFDHGLTPLAKRVPAPVRRRLRSRFVARDAEYEARLAASEAPLPAVALEAISRDAAPLRQMLGIAWTDDGPAST